MQERGEIESGQCLADVRSVSTCLSALSGGTYLLLVRLYNLRNRVGEGAHDNRLHSRIDYRRSHSSGVELLEAWPSRVSAGSVVDVPRSEVFART